ncbi:hypothetical protein Droror1_Dr00002199, partial [Drosera rotundifolia]
MPSKKTLNCIQGKLGWGLGFVLSSPSRDVLCRLRKMEALIVACDDRRGLLMVHPDSLLADVIGFSSPWLT